METTFYIDKNQLVPATGLVADQIKADVSGVTEPWIYKITDDSLLLKAKTSGTPVEDKGYLSTIEVVPATEGESSTPAKTITFDNRVNSLEGDPDLISQWITGVATTEYSTMSTKDKINLVLRSSSAWMELTSEEVLTPFNGDKSIYANIDGVIYDAEVTITSSDDSVTAVSVKFTYLDQSETVTLMPGVNVLHYGRNRYRFITSDAELTTLDSCTIDVIFGLFPEYGQMA